MWSGVKEKLRSHSSAVIYQPSCQGFILEDIGIGLTPTTIKSMHNVTHCAGAA